MLFCTPDFIIDMPLVYIESNYWSKKFLKLEYSVKIIGDHVESKGKTASSLVADILNQW
jgi:hypothetical protein